MRTWRSRCGQCAFSATAGLEASSNPFRLCRLVKNTKPRGSKDWINTMRLEGRPAPSTVERQTALGSTLGPKAASLYHSRYFAIGSITPRLLLPLDQSFARQLFELGHHRRAGISRLGRAAGLLDIDDLAVGTD